MEGQDTDEGVDISITDEVDSDLDLIAGTDRGTGFVEPETGA